MNALLALALLACVAAHGASAQCCSGMTMNDLGLQLTESSEGYVDHVYNDAAGNPTVCYGHLITAGQTFPNPVPYSTCVALLRQDLGSAESCVQSSVSVPLNTNQFSALVDFTFNLGCGALWSSTLLRVLNQGEYSEVPAQMARWTYAGGRQLPGLVTRRANEGTLWSTPVGGATNAPAASTTPAPASQVTAAPSAAPSAAATTTDAPQTTQPPPPPTTERSIWSYLGASTAGKVSSGAGSGALPGFAIALIVVGSVFVVLGALVAVAKFSQRRALPDNHQLTTTLLSDDAQVAPAHENV